MKQILQPGDSVFRSGLALATTVDCIALRQGRGMCARLSYGDGSGEWVEVNRIVYLPGLLRAWQVREDCR